jgi:hypothetical protein
MYAYVYDTDGGFFEGGVRCRSSPAVFLRPTPTPSEGPEPPLKGIRSDEDAC